MEPVHAYENRRESQTLQELVVKIEGNKSHLMLESLMITERILGKYNPQILRGVRYAAPYYENIKLSTCSGLHRHALKTAKSCNKSPVEDIYSIKELIKMYENFWSDEEKQACAVELLEHIVNKYEQRVKVLDATRKGHDEELLLLDCSV